MHIYNIVGAIYDSTCAALDSAFILVSANYTNYQKLQSMPVPINKGRQVVMAKNQEGINYNRKQNIAKLVKAFGLYSRTVHCSQIFLIDLKLNKLMP